MHCVARKDKMFRLVLLCACFAATASAGCQRIVCYYTNWAQYRPAPFKFVPEDMDPSMCTHINYAFAKLKSGQLAAFEWNDDSEDWMVGMYARSINHMKQKNPTAKILVSVGGWNMGSSDFTAIVATAEGRNKFAKTALKFLRGRGFNGLDLDWEYPANRGSPPEDRENYILWIQEIDRVFRDESIKTGSPRLLLTAATSAGKNTTETGYIVAEMAKYLDFVNIMTYDLHGPWESKTGHNSPLFAHSSESGEDAYLNVAWAANHWVSLGLPKDKLVIGLPIYGRTFTLTSTSSSGIGATTSGAGTAGKYTREKGFLSYYEICDMVAKGAVVHRISDQKVPYLVSGNQWVGYDDATSLIEKVRFMKNNMFGGVMIWALDLDDFNGNGCGGQKYPLLRTIFNECGGLPHDIESPPVAPSPTDASHINRPKYRPPIQVIPKTLPKYRGNIVPSFQTFRKQKPKSVPPSIRKRKPVPVLPKRTHFPNQQRPHSTSPASRSVHMFQLPTQSVNPGFGLLSGPMSVVQRTYQANPERYHVISQHRGPPSSISIPRSRPESQLSVNVAPSLAAYLSANEAIAAFLSSRLASIPDYMPARPAPDTTRPASIFSILSRENSRPISFGMDDRILPRPRSVMAHNVGPRTISYFPSNLERQPTSFVSEYSQGRPRRRYTFGENKTPNTDSSLSQTRGTSISSIFSTRDSALSSAYSPYYALAKPKPKPLLRQQPYVKSKSFSDLSSFFNNDANERSYPTGGIGKPNTYFDDSEASLISATDRLLKLAGIDLSSLSEFNCIGKADGLYPCPKSCKHFYTCQNQIAFRKLCAPGLIYNPGTKFCDWPYNYKCKLPVTAPALPGDTATAASPDQPPSTASSAPVPEVTSKDFCAHRHNGRYMDPTTCANYIECVSHITYVMPCAQGTVYSRDTSDCRAPANVPNCSA